MGYKKQNGNYSKIIYKKKYQKVAKSLKVLQEVVFYTMYLKGNSNFSKYTRIAPLKKSKDIFDIIF